MEPFITSTLSVAQKIPTRDFSGLATGVVVNSKVGFIKPTLITSPRQFLEVYTLDKKLSKGDHPSLLNAFYLSRFTDLVVARANSSTVYPLVPIGGLSNGIQDDATYVLPNGNIAEVLEVLVPHVDLDPGDYRSLYLQIDNVLFYGKGQMNPFKSGDGVQIDGTATTIVKATTPEALIANGLPPKEQYITIELSKVLTFFDEPTGIITLNESVYPEIVKHFSGGGAAEKSYLNVELNEAKDGFRILSSKDSYEGSSWFAPVEDPEDMNRKNVYNLSVNAQFIDLDLSSPYFIGTTNVGTVNTVKAWFSDVKSYYVEDKTYFNWNLNITDPINGEQSYRVSDNPDAVDAQGNPIYFTWISEFRPEILFLKNRLSQADPVGSDEPLVVNVGKSQYYIDSISSESDLIQSASHAALGFEEYEDYRIQLYTDAGWYHPAIAKSFEAVATVKYGLNCVGIDPLMKDVNLIKKYGSGFNSYYSIIHANAGKDTSVVGFQIPVSPSCYFIETIAKNASRNAIYAPVFSKINGSIEASSLYYTYTKTERDLLNKARINVLVNDKTDAVSYINNNLLSTTAGTLIDEDQSIRIINEIRYDVNNIMKNYYSLFNTSETRNSVEAAINSYFSSDIMNQTYTISGFNVICTEVNNTLATIQNNELHVEIQIKLNNSIKFITIITNIVPTL
jgi:hypothetical protein